MPVTIFLYPSQPKIPSLSRGHSSSTLSSSSKPKALQICTPAHPSNSRGSFSILATSVNSDNFVLLESSSTSNAAVKMPTAPWMKGPLLLQPSEVIDLSNSRKKKRFNNGKAEKSDWALTDKVNVNRGRQEMRQEMQKIFRSIEKLLKIDNPEKKQIAKRIEFGACLEYIPMNEKSGISERMPWEREDRIDFPRVKKEKVATAAELNLDKDLLERLRAEAAKLRLWVKVKKAGVTQAVVDEIKLIWKRSELAMVKFDIPLCRNIDRAQEIVELKTGGLVVWRKKNVLVIYRGSNHPLTFETECKKHRRVYRRETSSSETKEKTSQAKTNGHHSNEIIGGNDCGGRLVPSSFFLDNINCPSRIGSLYERETDRLLDDLGPRFIDWWMHKPLPVDADMLPEVVTGFKPPYRRCPPRTNSKLNDDELTYLRKIARPLPTHFVLGRNRGLQGLASAILKLWEKSLVAKIAIKFGDLNTNNQQMAYELKSLTGGVLLLRNKFLIILYRGKDFLSGRVANLIAERETELIDVQLHEERARIKANQIICLDDKLVEETTRTGTLSDFQNIQAEFIELVNGSTNAQLQLEAEKVKLKSELRKEEHFLTILNFKIEKSAKELSRLNAAWTPSELDSDREIITEEERECYRKIGLKLDSHLILGRRGIFDGVIEGIRQHWKHREIVKVITMQRAFKQVMYTAKLLEAETGGILISVEKLKEGHSIIIYRGKNYRRPFKTTSNNLLTKRKALLRSLEMQRLGSLKFFANQKQKKITELKLKLEDLQNRKGLLNITQSITND